MYARNIIQQKRKIIKKNFVDFRKTIKNDKKSPT